MSIDPTIQGFPDYMYPNGASPSVLFQQSYVNSGEVTIGPFDVSSWPITELQFFPSAIGAPSTHLQISTLYTTQDYLLSLSAGKVSYLQANCYMIDNTINVGSNVKINISPRPAGGTFTGDVVIIERGGLAGPSHITNPLINMPSQVVAAGGLVTTNATLATPGPAQFFVASSAAGWAWALDMLMLNGVWVQINGSNSPAGGPLTTFGTFDMPSSQLRMRVANQTGGPLTLLGNVVQRGY